ncbi:hypothetical protein AOLI_G00098880 [Acnodon oligacanthus]
MYPRQRLQSDTGRYRLTRSLTVLLYEATQVPLLPPAGSSNAHLRPGDRAHLHFGHASRCLSCSELRLKPSVFQSDQRAVLVEGDRLREALQGYVQEDKRSITLRNVFSFSSSITEQLAVCAALFLTALAFCRVSPSFVII